MKNPDIRAKRDALAKMIATTRRKLDEARAKKAEKALVEGLGMLIETELEKAEVVIAAKGVLDKVTKAAETLASIEADDIMPMLDALITAFGQQSATQYQQGTVEALRAAVESLTEQKGKMAQALASLEGIVNGDESGNDMASFDATDADADADSDAAGTDLGGAADVDAALGADDDAAPAVDDEAAATPDEPTADPFAGDDEVGNPAGRMRKESATRRGPVLNEGARLLTSVQNPDALVLAAFEMAARTGRPSAAVQRVAEAFGIDADEVITLVREGRHTVAKGARKAMESLAARALSEEKVREDMLSPGNSGTAPAAGTTNGGAGATTAPGNSAQQPPKPVSPVDQKKATDLAQKISSQQPNLRTSDVENKVKQNIGSVGMSQGDVPQMTGLVTQTLAQGGTLKEAVVLMKPAAEDTLSRVFDMLGLNESAFGGVQRGLLRDGEWVRPVRNQPGKIATANEAGKPFFAVTYEGGNLAIAATQRIAESAKKPAKKVPAKKVAPKTTKKA